MLHVIYRSYGGENKKGRPAYYSKFLALSSMVRAFEALAPGSAELIFLNDGPIPQDRLRLMQASGEVLMCEPMGLRGSMRAALALPVDRRWGPNDLVWLAEDDYLYLPHALTGLQSAAKAFPAADYFGLYAQIGDRQPNGALPGEERVPRRWRTTEPVQVEGHGWQRALSTTSTFGGRAGVLAEDRRMMDIAMRTGGAWDHTTCLIYQGFLPYPPGALLRTLRQIRDVPSLVRQAGGALARLAVNGYPIMRSLAGVRERLLVAPDPALITHLEIAYLASGSDWQAFAYDMQSWAEARWSQLELAEPVAA